MRRDTPYLSIFSTNAGKYGPGKLRIRTLFTQRSARYENETTEYKHHDDENSFNRQIYFEALDSSMNFIKERFEQKDYRECYQKVENLPL